MCQVELQLETDPFDSLQLETEPFDSLDYLLQSIISLGPTTWTY